ncbi:oxidase [Lithospermum erythrorhizon]|uniref:Sulfhydryl oxidase n=1 Tax=Lithospermum erythrorhizon TaxID=34254 RepID=A0AAV3REW1_LITER
MSSNPVELMLRCVERVSRNLSKLIFEDLHNPNKTTSSTTNQNTAITVEKSSPVTKEDLGRATWTFLHTLGAQYPDAPTRQQKRDVKELMSILSRMYPCKDCADHFQQLLKTNPVQVGSHAEFSQWLCHVHNVVNRSLGKLKFPCERVDARWGKLECEQHTCDLHGDLTDFKNERH